MKNKYPIINEILVDLKKSGQKPFIVFAKMETKIIFDIVEELYQKYSEIRILTCHDAIYVPRSFKSEASIIWHKHMNILTSKLPVEFDSEVPTEPEEIYSIDEEWGNEL